MLRKRWGVLVSGLLILAMLFTFSACGGGGDAAQTDEGAGTEEAADAAQTDESAGDAAAEAPADASASETVTPGKLTIATGEPAWEPWVLNDDPESGEGFESAVAYAVAEKLGYAKEDVVWVRTQFDEAINPGPKDFDFNLQQYSITEERKQVVDFSSPYYKEPLVVITKKDTPIASATSIAELKDAVFGAPAGDIAGQYITENIQPTDEVQIYNNLSDTFAALNTGQIDATVVGMLTGDYVINVEGEQVENGIVLGSLTGSENATEGLGLLLPKDSPLTASVTQAVDELAAAGTLDTLKEQWLSQYEIKELS
jgi:polar amino acid transport system substrate-binding protein